MALQPQGGLGQASAQQQAPQQKAPASQPQAAGNINVGARASGMEQEEVTPVSDYVTKTMEDIDATRDSMNRVIQRLRAGLDDRKNQLFDPVMMAAAAGFAKPTRTGSFGESAGYAAEGASSAAEKEMLRQKENQKMELELSQRELEMRQQMAGDAMMRQILPSMGGGKPSGGMPAGGGMPPIGGGAPIAANAPVPSIGAPPAPSEGVQVASAAPNVPLSPSQQILQAARSGVPITDELMWAAKRIGDKNLISILDGMQKRQQEQDKLRLEAEKTDIERQKFSLQTRDVYVGDLRETIKMDAKDYADYQQAREAYKKTKDYQALFQFYSDKGYLRPESRLTPEPTGTPSAGAAGTAPAGVPAAGGVAQPPVKPTFQPPKSPEQLEVEKQEEITRRAEQRKADQVQVDRMQLGRDTSQERVIAADSIYGLAESKDTGRVFEFFTKPTIRNIIATAIEGKQGVRTPLGTLEIQNIKKAMQLAGATPSELSAAQMILRNSTMLNLQDTISLMPKQGAITEGERVLIANLNPNVWEDTRDSAMAKSQLVKARAEYDQDVSKIYSDWKKRNPTGLMDDFKQSRELTQRYDQYGQVTKQIANKYFPNIKPAPSTRVQPSSGGSLESQIR
jgi:hypothetical protein